MAPNTAAAMVEPSEMCPSEASTPPRMTAISPGNRKPTNTDASKAGRAKTIARATQPWSDKIRCAISSIIPLPAQSGLLRQFRQLGPHNCYERFWPTWPSGTRKESGWTMKIAVTGATGFLGRPLVRKLIRDGHSVTALVRHPDQTAAVEGAPVQKFDTRAPLNPGTLVGQEAVIHLAREDIAQRWNEERKGQILERRNAGTDPIIKTAYEGKKVKDLLK